MGSHIIYRGTLFVGDVVNLGLSYVLLTLREEVSELQHFPTMQLSHHSVGLVQLQR
jgi:hypothetical protein